MSRLIEERIKVNLIDEKNYTDSTFIDFDFTFCFLRTKKKIPHLQKLKLIQSF